MKKIDTVYRAIPVYAEGIIGDYAREISVLCDTCAYFDAELTCTAFPDGIPEEILSGEHDHRTPYPGDNGIMFEPVEEGK